VRPKGNAVVSFLAEFENYGDKVLLIVAFADLQPGIGDLGAPKCEASEKRCPFTASCVSFFGRFFLRCLSLSRRGTFRGFLGGGGFFSARRAGRSLLFRCLFVRIASVVSAVKSRSFEDQTCAGTEQTFYFAVSPLRQPAKLFRAFAKWFVTHRLECVEVLAALLTRILVSWHQEYGSARSADNAGKSALKDVQFNPKQMVN
jgi:hypothetical protein